VTTLCRTRSAVFECCIGPGRGGDKERQEEEERNEIKEEESAVIDRRRKLEEVDIDDEDKESMDEGIMSDI
jgi:hypothetical protein